VKEVKLRTLKEEEEEEQEEQEEQEDFKSEILVRHT